MVEVRTVGGVQPCEAKWSGKKKRKLVKIARRSRKQSRKMPKIEKRVDDSPAAYRLSIHDTHHMSIHPHARTHARTHASRLHAINTSKQNASDIVSA